VGEGETGNCKRLRRCESKGEIDGCNIVAVGFDRLNLGGWKLVFRFGQLKLSGCESQRERDTSGWVWLAES
jgi:hypothetical protein